MNSIEASKERRFTAAGRTDQNDEFLVSDLQVELLNSDNAFTVALTATAAGIIAVQALETECLAEVPCVTASGSQRSTTSPAATAPSQCSSSSSTKRR